MKIVTMDNFLLNPVGKGSASFGNRGVMIQNLNNRFDSLYRGFRKFFHCKFFIDQGCYYFVFKIPSEKFYKDLSYDVVLKFIPIGNSNSDLTLKNYALNVFSNSPNFLFTYAYVYNKDGIIVPLLKYKISKKALTEAPVVRNPDEAYGFEKSVYFALLYLKTNNLTLKANLKKPNDINKDTLKQEIASCNQKLKEYDYQNKVLQSKKHYSRKVISKKLNQAKNKTRKKFKF